MEYTISKNNIHIIDSYLISKNEFDSELKIYMLNKHLCSNIGHNGAAMYNNSKFGIKHMKPIKQFQMGSTYFFSKYKDFKPKDYDDLCIMDTFIFPGCVMNMKLNGKDVFLFRNMPKQGYIDDLLNSGVNMKAGKFLIPEFNEYINFTIDDLKSILHIFENMDSKHSYEKIIAESYIENNGFFLTGKQRRKAYAEYKKSRK